MKQRRLFVIVLLVVTVVLLIAVGSGYWLYGDAVAENEKEALQTSADSTAIQLDALLTERIRTVTLLGTDPVFRPLLVDGGDPDTHTRETIQRFINVTEFQGASLINADGRMVEIESAGLSEANRSALIGADFGDRQYFQEAMNGKTYVSEPVEAETGNYIVTVSVPIEQNGTVIGTLNAALHLDNGSFFDSIAPNNRTEMAIRVSSGNRTLHEFGPWAKDDLTTASATKTTGWTVTVAQPDSAVGEQALTVTALQIGAVLLVVGTLVGFALWFYRSSLRQTARILDGFDRLGDREYGTEVDVGGTEEWTRIGDRFNAVSTELARHERELTQYREVVEHLEDPIILQDTEGRLKLINETIGEYAGYTKAELVGEPESLFVDEDTAEKLDERRQETLRTQQAVEFEIEPVFENGDRRPTFSVRQNPYYDDSGQLAGTISIWRDVTRLKENETELTQYKRAIQEATDLICVVDTDEQYLFANPQYRSYHGIGQADVTGTTVPEVVESDVYEKMSSYLDRALNGAIVKFRSTRTHPTRGERTLDVRYFPLEEDGETTGVVAVLRDVTEREERAQQLSVVDRVLRHNLRNDLTVIGLQAEQIRAESSGTIQDAATEILDHANGLLTTSDKSRSITEVLSQEPTVRAIDIVPIVREVANSVGNEHGIEIAIESPTEAYANTTPYFPNAIEELLENGVVHSDGSAPTLELTVAVDPEWVRIRVIDDGPGIAAMDKDVLETGRTTDDLYHGSGLGLWLVYWIVHRSGGSITVQDDQTDGTVIKIKLSRPAEW